MGQGQPPTPVQLEQVSADTVQEFSEFVGALEAQKKVALRPEVSARVVEVLVTPGQRVEAGTVIAQLRADQTRAEASGAAADVAASSAAVTTNQARVRAADAERARAAADVELQNREYERTRLLVAEGALSQQELDRAANQRATALASLRVAEENLGAAQAALAETQAQLGRARADQEVAREDVSDRRLTAPIAGVVGDIPFKVGDLVSSSDTFTNIIQNGTLELNLSVPIERAPDLRVGLPVELLDATGKAVSRGQISFISPEVNAGQQSVLAKASFQNDGALKDGQFVRTRVIWSSKPGVLIPTVAVTRIAGQTFVFVAEQGEGTTEDGKPQQIARQRQVTLGEIQGNAYQVISGVESGEQVVVSGVLNLQDGAPIMLEQAMGQP